MTINEDIILLKDRDGVRIPQHYKKATESFVEVSEEFPLPVGFGPNSSDSQYPLPISSDRVYCVDINESESSTGDFDGEICDLVNDYTSVNIAPSVGSGGVNPKSFKVVLHGPLKTSTIGLGSPDSSLSNGKLILRGIDGNDIREPIDLSSDSTKRGIMFFQFEETAFIEAEIEFYTDDEVTVGGLAVFKTQDVTVSSINGLFPHDAQTNAALIADDEWVSGIIDTKNYVWVIASCYTDSASAADGFVVEFSSDKINWYWQATYTIAAGGAKTFSEQPVARYMRVRFGNGPGDQGAFEVSVKLSPVPSKPSSHRLVDELDGQDDAELTMSQILGLSELTGNHENVGTFRRALKVDTALVHKVGVNELFSQLTGDDTTLAIASLAGDISIDVVSAAAYSIGEQLEINSERYHFHITGIATNNITLDRPLDLPHAIGSTVKEVIIDMVVVGTLANPQSFRIAPPPDEIWQITRIITAITDATSMDDGKFGGIAALTNGIVIRSNRNGVLQTGTIWKTNGDMALDQYDLTYTDKAPAGQYGLRGRWTFTKAEFIVELDGSTNDYAEVLVQDALTGLLSFNLKAQGRVFGG